MQLKMMLEPIGRVGVVTVDGALDSNREIGPLLDQFLYGLASQGWTLLLGARDQPPRMVDPVSAMRALARQMGFDPAGGEQPAPAPKPSEAKKKAVDVEDEAADEPSDRTALFRSWAPGDPGDPEPDSDDPDPEPDSPSRPPESV